MISIAICEDSIPVQSQIESILHAACPDCPTEVFSSGEELLAHVRSGRERFQLYLMDISMPGMSGIEAASAIRQSDPYALIVYVTDHKEYVYQVFETLPFRFLIKPVEESALERVLADAVRHLESRLQLFHFQIERCRYQIPLQEILYLESRLREIHLYTKEQTWQFYGRLGVVEQELDPMLFVRTHMSYIVNLDYIRSITDTGITLRTGTYIPISKRYRESVREKHLQYLKWRAGQ